MFHSMSPRVNIASLIVAKSFIDWPQFSWIIPELFTLDYQEIVFFDYENKKGWAFGPPLG